jgi:hypothetical protein
MSTVGEEFVVERLLDHRHIEKLRKMSCVGEAHDSGA